MPRTADPRDFQFVDVGRCSTDVVSCIPPAEAGVAWAISVQDNPDVIVQPDDAPEERQEYACVTGTSVLSHALGDVFGAEVLEAPAEEPAAHSQARPVYRGDAPQVEVDANELLVRIQGEPVGLTRTQFSILAYLIQHSGRWVTTSELIREVLGTHHQPDTSLVRVHVHAIRRRLGGRAAWVESDRRRARGYRWRPFDAASEDEQERQSS